MLTSALFCETILVQTQTKPWRVKIMRQQFIETTDKDYATTQCPWACECVKVNGGYMCFESATDLEVWANQE